MVKVPGAVDGDWVMAAALTDSAKLRFYFEPVDAIVPALAGPCRESLRRPVASSGAGPIASAR